MGTTCDTDPGTAHEGGQDRILVDNAFDTFEWRLDDREEPDRMMVPPGANVGALQWEADAEVAVFA